ncbi:hypothetical protein LEP1GSC050_2585 [Leptospira broomii serovar Hurstbridge str. 5399]|uniref:Uncharacterized protein n=1 Tax=Leptospira broomii serovar Hurstbridge str. 5399 TaxID=1049789 RepID=T0FCV8_9LEPT|nr:hypothetical protein LEP1GSC050_2585 [Leptospira broomii serovar Hurstbridge str. 5399]
MLKAIHSQENKEEALKKANFVVERLNEMKLKEASKIVSCGIEETPVLRISHPNIGERYERIIL